VAKQSQATVIVGETCEPPTKTCLSTGECAENEYCLKPLDQCEGVGTCEKKPDDDACDLAPFIEGGVCGCDSVTYEKSCLAAIAGVSIFAEKACDKPPETQACKSTVECGKSAFCQRPLGDCDAAQGVCIPIPAISSCGELPSNPVCGCNNKGYENECFAYSAQISIAKTGICK